jgi:hypothetical protein
METKMSKSNLRTAILILGGITAVIHIAISFVFGSFDLIFLLNGLGFIGLLWVILHPPEQLKGFKRFFEWTAIAYTLATIVLFFVFNAETGYGALGLLTKVDEILLIIAIFMHMRE